LNTKLQITQNVIKYVIELQLIDYYPTLFIISPGKMMFAVLEI